MIDIHAHILYGIDDGSQSLDMSLAMLRMSAASDVSDIIATPHVNRRGVVPAWSTITAKVKELQTEADNARIPIHIHAGAEVELNYHTLSFIKKGSRDYCLAGSRYILCELTEQSQVDQVETLLYELSLRGFVPVLAHPERYDRIMRQPGRVLEWLRRGTLAQCDTGSFACSFGLKAQEQAKDLLRNHMIVFLGSDAHRIEARNTDLYKAYTAIAKLDKNNDTWKECSRNGEKLLHDKILYPDFPKKWVSRKNFLSRLFGSH